MLRRAWFQRGSIQAPPAYDVFAQIVREILDLDLDDVQTDVWQKLRAGLAELDPNAFAQARWVSGGTSRASCWGNTGT